MADNDTLEAAKELVTVLAGNNEVCDAKVAIKYLQKSKEIKFKHAESSKAAVLLLKERIATADSNMGTDEMYETIRRLEEIQEVKDAKVAQVADLEESFKHSRACLQDSEQESESLSDQKRALDETFENDIPRLKNLFQLYTNISKIRWDYQCGEEEIKGYICGSKDVKPIFMKSEQSAFYSCNYLWDLVKTVQ